MYQNVIALILKRNRKRSGYLVTLNDVARDTGYSRATVSRVLNNKDEVRPGTLAKVRASMEKLGYVPNIAASALSRGVTNSIGILLPDNQSLFYFHLIRGFNDIAQEYSKHIILKSYPMMDAAISIINSGGVDGFIIRHSRNYDKIEELIRSLRKKGIPYVSIGKPGIVSPEGDSVAILVDNVGGGRQMAHHFAERMVDKILIISGDEDNFDSRDRVYGFRLGLEEKGYNINKNIFERQGDFSKEKGYDTAKDFFGEHHADAVFAVNDQMAIGVMYFLHEQGIMMPETVRIAGFDDAFFAEYLWPPLTTIRQPMYEIGRIAMRSLLDTIQKKTLPTGEIILPTELIVRSSC